MTSHAPLQKPITPFPGAPTPTFAPTSQKPTAQTSLRTPSNRKTIYDRNLNRTRTAELSRASFAYLFAEIVSYAQKRVTGIQDLEKRYIIPPSPIVYLLPTLNDTLRTRLSNLGHPLGLRLLPLLLHRTSPSPLSSSSPLPTRPTRIIPLLNFIARPLWTHLFGRPADAIEHSASAASDNEYMITDNEPLVNQYISVPREMSQLNCAAFVAGVVEGVCCGCGMGAGVSAHWVGGEEDGGGGGKGREGEMWPGKTVFLIRFEEGVVEREKGGGG